MKRILILAFGIVLFGTGMAFSDDPNNFWLRVAIGAVAVTCFGIGLVYAKYARHESIEASTKRKLILVFGPVLFGMMTAMRGEVDGIWLRAGIEGLAAALLCLIWMYVPQDERGAE